MFAYVWNEIERNTDNLPRIYTEILRQIYLNWVFPECTYVNVLGWREVQYRLDDKKKQASFDIPGEVIRNVPKIRIYTNSFSILFNGIWNTFFKKIQIIEISKATQYTQLK